VRRGFRRATMEAPWRPHEPSGGSPGARSAPRQAAPIDEKPREDLVDAEGRNTQATSAPRTGGTGDGVYLGETKNGRRAVSLTCHAR
jgi:hypothetical protein